MACLKKDRENWEKIGVSLIEKKAGLYSETAYFQDMLGLTNKIWDKSGFILATGVYFSGVICPSGLKRKQEICLYD